MSLLSQSKADDIIEYLDAAAGASRNLSSIYKAMNMDCRACRLLLVDMVSDGLIHEDGFMSQSYYSGEVREKLDIAPYEPLKAKPLKVDKYRLALYAELAAARGAIKSKG